MVIKKYEIETDVFFQKKHKTKKNNTSKEKDKKIPRPALDRQSREKIDVASFVPLSNITLTLEKYNDDKRSAKRSRLTIYIQTK